MEILEIVGESIAANDAELGRALRRVEETVKAQKAKDTSADEKQRIRDIIALCFEYDREEDKDERRNIEETLRELIINAAMALPTKLFRSGMKSMLNLTRVTLSFVSVIGSDGSNL